MELNIQVGDYLLTASLAQNSSVDTLVEMLSEGSVTIRMIIYGILPDLARSMMFQGRN